jgi:hypothetical protein
MISRKADLAEKPQTAPHDLLEFCLLEFCAPGAILLFLTFGLFTQTTWRDR